MAQLVIEFDWARDPKGYRLAEVGRRRMLKVVRNGKGHTPKDFQHCRPLSLTDQLFRIFANTATTPKGVLEFVQRYGPLTQDGRSAMAGDPVNVVMFNADRMREVLRCSSGDQKQPAFPPGRQYHLCPSSSLDAAVVWDDVMMAPKWELRPKSLLDALWLQLGQALTRGARLRQCEHCGDWFETGRRTGRRLDAKFCSDEHRIAFNSLKRSKGK